MTDPTPTSASPDVVILLPHVPATLGEVFGFVAPELATKLGQVPPVDQLIMTINQVEVDFGLHTQPCTDPALMRDLGGSPLRSRLQGAVTEHRAYATIALAAGQDRTRAARELITFATASILDESAATTVWLPAQLLVTSDVLYVGDVARDRMELTWFRVHSMWLDDARTESIGFTRGLSTLGWPELMLRSEQDPGQLWQEFTEAVGSRVDGGKTAPRSGEKFTVAERKYVLQPGVDPVGAEVLELGGAERAKRSWFRRR